MCRENEIDLQLGVRNGQVVFIDEVERGLDCDCYCPHCGGRLIAKKGEIKQHHFAHYNADNCGKGMETALHLLGKQVLLNEQKLRLPDTDEPTDLIDPTVERRRFGYIADVGAVVAATGEEVDIEIKVTHGVDDNKRANVVQHNALMVEIDLSELLSNGTVTRDLVTEKVVNTADRVWIQSATDTEEPNSTENDRMGEKYLVVGFKSVSGYSRKNNSSFATDRLHVLVKQANRPSRNYQIHSIAGYEQQSVPLKLTPALAERLERQQYPAWAYLKLETEFINGATKPLVTDIFFEKLVRW